MGEGKVLRRMDRRDAFWFMGFLLRQLTEGYLAGGSLGRLPVLPCLDPRLKKTMLLRFLSSDLATGGLSNKTLQALEILEELGRRLGAAQTSESLKAAYCAVAAELTAAPLRSGSRADFFEAVNSIWNCRVADLERSEARGMMGEGLREWRRLMEEAVVSDAAREAVLRRDTRAEALEALKEYLKERGSSLLDPAFRAGGGESGIEGISRGTGERNSTREPGVSEETSDATGAPQMNLSRSNRPAAVTGAEGVPFLLETVELLTERKKRGMISGQMDTPGQDRILKELDCLSIPEINKAKEALKSTLAELQKAVEDPLPNALLRAAEVQKSMVVKSANSHDANKGQDQMDVCAPGPSIQMDAHATLTERVAAQGLNGISCPSKSRRSLIDHNPSSRTYEWDEDSIEVSSINSRDSLRREHLSTSRNQRASVLQTRELTKFVRRRKARRWSPQEEDALREGVKGVIECRAQDLRSGSVVKHFMYARFGRHQGKFFEVDLDAGWTYGCALHDAKLKAARSILFR
ncbi:hypothetical protein Taro_016352 [Colocasia esculenta]|uniref:Uncharacterized protein n=1 Tax=Colocasia esculenta TaxID=4460 RepID=A0A843UQ04_COLES|nr:hypothetical protein [Colocasia esculenta]